MRNPRLLAALALFALGLSACTDSGSSGLDGAGSRRSPQSFSLDGGAGGQTSGTADPQSPCISKDCGEKEVLVHIPEAENLIFSDDGRLFVTGWELYEVVKAKEGHFDAVVIPADGSHSNSLGGLAIAHGVLYMNDENGRGLWAGRLQPGMHMQKIHTYKGYPTPNGLALGPDGALYSTSGPLPDLTTLTSVVRVKLDPNDPFKVIDEEKVFGLGDLTAANGLVLKGSTFYVVGYLSDGLQLSSVQAFDVQPDGSVGPLRKIASAEGSFDDIEVIGDRLLVANNFFNSLLMFDLEGKLLVNSGPIFAGPAALTYGQPPMFAATDLLVAERGILGEGSSNYGNDLAVFRRRAP